MYRQCWYVFAAPSSLARARTRVSSDSMDLCALPSMGLGRWSTAAIELRQGSWLPFGMCRLRRQEDFLAAVDFHLDMGTLITTSPAHLAPSRCRISREDRKRLHRDAMNVAHGNQQTAKSHQHSQQQLPCLHVTQDPFPLLVVNINFFHFAFRCTITRLRGYMKMALETCDCKCTKCYAEAINVRSAAKPQKGNDTETPSRSNADFLYPLVSVYHRASLLFLYCFVLYLVLPPFHLNPALRPATKMAPGSH